MIIGIDEEKEAIDEAKRNLKILDKATELANLNGKQDLVKKLLDQVSVSFLFGRKEVVPGVQRIPDWFYGASKRDQLAFFDAILLLRQMRLRRVTQGLRSYGERGKSGDIRKYI